MATLIFLSIPAHGHINPTLPVVAELVQRGHRVIYYDTEEFRTKIEPTGAEFRAYPEPMPSSADIVKMLADGNIVRVSIEMLRTTERLMPFTLEMLQRERPDAVVFDSLALWGMMAARRLQLPSVASISHFVFDPTGENAPGLRDFVHWFGQILPMLPEVIRIRCRLAREYPDVFPRRDIFPTRGSRSLIFTSADLQPKTNQIDSTFRFVGASINPVTREADFPFDQLTRKPLTYISLGTINNLDTHFYRETFSAFADHPGQFILSAGQHIDMAQLGTIPANFIVRPSVPQLAILQHSDLFISHGGMNSIHESLYYGVPLLIVPQQMEQLLNGRIVAAKGAGVLIGDKPPYGQVTAGQLRTAADEVLRSSSYRQNAQSRSESLRAAGGYRHAADEIEQIASQQVATTP